MVQPFQGFEAWTQRPTPKAYRSPYAPVYHTRRHFHGVSLGSLAKYGGIAAGFGISAGTLAFFFLSEVPRVRQDIMTKLPMVGDYFIREIPPEDNPF